MSGDTSHLAGVHSLTTPECNNLATQTLATRSTLPVLRRLNEFHTCTTADGTDQTTSNIVAGAVGGTLSGLLVAVLVAAVVIIIVVLGYRRMRKG